MLYYVNYTPTVIAIICLHKPIIFNCDEQSVHAGKCPKGKIAISVFYWQEILQTIDSHVVVIVVVVVLEWVLFTASDLHS